MAGTCDGHTVVDARVTQLQLLREREVLAVERYLQRAEVAGQQACVHVVLIRSESGGRRGRAETSLRVLDVEGAHVQVEGTKVWRYARISAGMTERMRVVSNIVTTTGRHDNWTTYTNTFTSSKTDAHIASFPAHYL